MRASIWYGGMWVATLLLVGCNAPSVSEDMRLASTGMEQIQEEEYQQAEKTLKKALEINPDNPYAILNLGVVYHQTGRPTKARKQYKKVIKNQKAAELKADRATSSTDEGKPLRKVARENLRLLDQAREESGGGADTSSGESATS